MTAEVVLVILLLAGSASVGGLLLAAFGQTGWLVILALAVAAALAWRVAEARLVARAAWRREDLRDEWRSS